MGRSMDGGCVGRLRVEHGGVASGGAGCGRVGPRSFGVVRERRSRRRTATLGDIGGLGVADGGARIRLQRVTALDAHRAASEASTDEARLAASCVGDAAGAAHLHPIARATQVGHILRAAAIAALLAELRSGGDLAVGDQAINEARQRATPVVIDVLGRYPGAVGGKNQIAQLVAQLDRALRA